MTTTEFNKLQGKKNRAAGARFETAVRKEMINQGYFVSKWQNNVEENQLVACKNKFRGPGLPMMLSGGFPDFIGFRPKAMSAFQNYEVIGVESKLNGKLSKEEKEKASWLLKNKVFSHFYIACKVDNKIYFNPFIPLIELKGGEQNNGS